MKKQIKTRLSRILCIALILCMIAALIPAAFAETVEETKDFSIDFFEFAQNKNGTTVEDALSLYGDVWKWHSDTVAGSVEFNKTYGLAIKSTVGLGDKEDVYVAFEFVPPATGKYNIDYKYAEIYSSGPAGGVGDVYILPSTVGDIETAISGIDGLVFDDVKYYNDSKNNYNAKLTFEDGFDLKSEIRYLVLFVTEEQPEEVTKSPYRMYPTSLTFTYVDPTYSDVKAVYSFSTTATDSANGYDSDLVGAPDEITYGNSKGRIQFDSVKSSETGNAVSQWNGNYACFDLNTAGEYAAYKIRVPKAGVYYATLEYYVRTANSSRAETYIFPSSMAIEEGIRECEPVIDEVDFASATTDRAYLSKQGMFYAETAGEYYLVFNATAQQGYGYVRPAKLTLSGSKDLTTTKGYPVAGINTEKTLFEEGESATLTYTANDSATGKPIDNVDVTKLESLNSEVISVNTANNTITAEGPGVATIIADVNGYPASVTLTVNDAEMTKAFGDVKADKGYATIGNKTVKVLKYFTDGKQGDYADDITVAYNGTASIKIEDIGTPEGYKFLYWAKGATDKKQIIPGETCTIYPTVEATYLIAVYEPISGTAKNKAEFYNYNGQLLTDVGIVGNEMPALPSMTGYGKAEYWAHYGSDITYEGGDPAPETSGTAIFVAQYKDLEENITVTAENCTVNGGSSAKVKYGDEVECVATDDGDEVFKWWTKTDKEGNTEIVSLDKEYTFKAWETCTVEAFYGDKAPTYVGDRMRIIIDELTIEGTDKKAVMAEFVGLDRAVEKGIMLGTKRYAMSSKDNQFTIINDNDVDVAEIKGYAILANGTLITDK